MSFDWETTPTPTIEEFVYSYDPRKWNPKTIEDLLYWEIKGALLVAPYATKMAFFMSRGMAFADAGYMASQGSLGAYRFISKLNRIKYIANPLVAVGAAAAVSAYYVHTSPAPTEALRSEPGQTSWWRAVAQAMTGTGMGVGSWNHGGGL